MRGGNPDRREPGPHIQIAALRQLVAKATVKHFLREKCAAMPASGSKSSILVGLDEGSLRRVKKTPFPRPPEWRCQRPILTRCTAARQCRRLDIETRCRFLLPPPVLYLRLRRWHIRRRAFHTMRARRARCRSDKRRRLVLRSRVAGRKNARRRRAKRKALAPSHEWVGHKRAGQVSAGRTMNCSAGRPGNQVLIALHPNCSRRLAAIALLVICAHSSPHGGRVGCLLSP